MDLDEFADNDPVVIGRNADSWWEKLPIELKMKIMDGVAKGYNRGTILRWLQQEYPEIKATRDKLSRGVMKGIPD